MGSEVRELVLSFLKKHKGKWFSVRNLHSEMRKEYPTIRTSYNTVLKWVDILVAMKVIKCKDYRFVKFVWYDEEGRVKIE